MYYLENNVLGQLLVFFLLGLSQAILVFLKILAIIIVITMLVKNFNNNKKFVFDYVWILDTVNMCLTVASDCSYVEKVVNIA